MSLQGTKGEEYIKAFPRFKKWINECICCHRKGYDPNMPENISVIEGSLGAQFIRQYFEPLAVNEYKLCEVCAKLMPAQAKTPDLKNIPKKQKNAKKFLKASPKSLTRACFFFILIKACVSREFFLRAPSVFGMMREVTEKRGEKAPRQIISADKCGGPTSATDRRLLRGNTAKTRVFLIRELRYARLS